MDNKVKAAVIFDNQYEMIKNVFAAIPNSAEIKTRLYEGMIEYQLYGVVPDFSDNIILNSTWNMIVRCIDSTMRSNQARRENGRKGAEYGKLGGRPKKGETKEEAYERRNGNTGVFRQENNEDEQVIIETPKASQIEEKAPLKATEDNTPINKVDETPEIDKNGMFTNPDLEFKDEPDEEFCNYVGTIEILNMENKKETLEESYRRRLNGEVNDAQTTSIICQILQNSQGLIKDTTFEGILNNQHIRGILDYYQLTTDDLARHLINKGLNELEGEKQEFE